MSINEVLQVFIPHINNPKADYDLTARDAFRVHIIIGVVHFAFGDRGRCH